MKSLKKYLNRIQALMTIKLLWRYVWKIQVALTYRCNKNCYYCYTRGLGKKIPMDMSMNDFYKVIRWLKRQNKNRIILTGGEPTAHPKFGKIIDICKKEGMRVSLNTNNLFDDSITKKIIKCHTDTFLINYNEPSFYTKTEYAQFERNLEAFNENRIKFFLYYKITSQNSRFNHLIQTARKYHGQIGLSLMVPGFLRQNKFSINELKILSKKVIKIIKLCENENVICLFLRPTPRCMFTDEQWKYINRYSNVTSKCYVGLNNNYARQLIINPDLSIFPCTGLFLKGPNILSFENLKEISNFYKNRFEELRWIPLMKKCGKCGYFLDKSCQGGCLNYKMQKNQIIELN